MLWTVILFYHVASIQAQECYLPRFNFDPIQTINTWNTTITLPNHSESLHYAPCSSLGTPSGCGTQGPPYNKCRNKPGCCAVCQGWNNSLGDSYGACLGQTQYLTLISALNSTTVKLTYEQGDLVMEDGTGRQVDVYISCDKSAAVLDFDKLVQPQVVQPPPPVYLYQLYLRSSALCQSGSRCPAQDGFNFGVISSLSDYKASWSPPNGAPTQTITYAPCSAGTSTGCGSGSWNQCYNQPGCCAVCETWPLGEDYTEGACLGLSSQLLGVSVINAITVKISYGGGDDVIGTPRQVDIYIVCDPSASETLSFIKFIQAIPQNPPPAYYLYELYLSSSSLCSEPLPQFLSSLGINI